MLKSILYDRMEEFAARRRTRGSALLLVVVLVLLLAMMGTAFLITVRLSREQTTGSNLMSLPDSAIWPGDDSNVISKLDTEALPLVETVAQWTIRHAVRPGDPTATGQPYRAPIPGFPSDFVHPAHPHSLFLASRMPQRHAGTPVWPVWPYISRLSVTHPDWASTDDIAVPFASLVGTRNPLTPPTTPLSGAGVVYADRMNLVPTSGNVTYPPTHDALRQLAARNRAFPALFDSVANRTYLAADADGDGIADSGLFDLTEYAGGDFRNFLQAVNAEGIVANPVGYLAVTRDDMQQHYVTYWGAIRIVDNSAAVNINTSLTSTADLDFTGAPIPTADALHALLGTFRPNVGFYELFASGTGAQVVQAGDVARLNTDFAALTQFRNQGTVASEEMVDEAGTVRPDAEFVTQGNALDHQLAARVNFPGYNYANGAAVRYRPLTVAANDELVFRFGLSNPFINLGTELRQQLPYLAHELTPNHAQLRHKRFAYYGAPQAQFWFNTIVDPDSSAGSERATFFSSAANNGVIDFAPDVSKSAKHHLVATNSVSNLAPDHQVAFAGLPAGVKTNTPAALPNFMPDTGDTPARVSVNRGTFGELWRAYWNVFQAAGANPPQARQAAARRGTTGWGVNEQVLTRAALAAVNTLTLRSPENDLVKSRTFQIPGFDVTVYGVKKQPYITEVIVEKDAADAPVYLAVELFNPYDVDIPLNGWRIGNLIGSTLTQVHAFPAVGPTVPANGFLTLEAGTRPVLEELPNFPNFIPTGNTETVDATVLDTFRNELVLLRPRRDDGTLSARTTAQDILGEGVYDESNVYDLVPVDQVNMVPDGDTPALRARFHYNRQTDQSTNPFRNVRAGDTELPPLARHDDRAGTLGADNDQSSITGDFIIPLAHRTVNEVNPISGSGNQFPFGGFARDGDMLHVPYIGHYRISASGTPEQILELNAVTADAIYADDAQTPGDALEQIGRFVPLTAMDPTYTDTDAYAFAGSIFSYLTATPVPTNDAIPNVDEGTYVAAGNPVPQPIGANDATEARHPVEGRININTAPWQVLATLPMIPGDPAANERLARAIVADRDQNGPYTSIISLNRVPANVGTFANVAFQSAVGDPTSIDFDETHGDLTPTDGLIGDYEQRTMAFTRISNLITTRSDSFTVYVLVQAWQDAGSQYPVMLAERRAVYTIDRSALSSQIGAYETGKVRQHNSQSR